MHTPLPVRREKGEVGVPGLRAFLLELPRGQGVLRAGRRAAGRGRSGAGGSRVS